MCHLGKQYKFVYTSCTSFLIPQHIPSSILNKLLEFATILDSRHYDQVDGVAMHGVHL